MYKYRATSNGSHQKDRRNSIVIFKRTNEIILQHIIKMTNNISIHAYSILQDHRVLFVKLKRNIYQQSHSINLKKRDDDIV